MTIAKVEPFDCVMRAQRLISELRLLIREVRSDNVDLRSINDGVEWNNFLIEYYLLKETMEDFDGKNFNFYTTT